MLGDRQYAVVDADGAALSARRRSSLLGFRARHRGGQTDPDLEIVDPAGRAHALGDPALGAALADALGSAATMARSAGAVHDAAPLHILTTASLAALADWVGDPELDRRRFRANVVIEAEGGEPFAETAWIGRTLELGSGGPQLEVVAPTERCAVTTFDPDTLERTSAVLGAIAARRENLFGVYAKVLRPGWARVGETVLTARPS